MLSLVLMLGAIPFLSAVQATDRHNIIGMLTINGVLAGPGATILIEVPEKVFTTTIRTHGPDAGGYNFNAGFDTSYYGATVKLRLLSRTTGGQLTLDKNVETFEFYVLNLNYVNTAPSVPAQPSGPTTGTTGELYSYTTSATDLDGDTIRYGWDWNGDGVVDEWTGYVPSGTPKTTSHAWSSVGLYQIKVKAEDSTGAQSDFSASLAVDISTTGTSGGGSGGGATNQPPVADTSAGELYQGVVGETIVFDGSKSYDPDGTIVKWFWTFGDGANGSGETVSHVYNRPGVFTVTLQVTDDQAATDTDVTTATITTANLPPSQPTLVGPTTGSLNVSYTYTATSTDSEGSALTYGFDWKDGTVTTITQPSGTPAVADHSWTTAGMYQVTVVVTDDQSASASASLTVLINVELVGDLGYLIDHDGDGTYDAFYSNQAMKQTSAEKQADGTYFIDSDGDGDWDYIYDPQTKTQIPFPVDQGAEDSTDTTVMVLGGILAVIAVLFVCIALLTRRKK